MGYFIFFIQTDRPFYRPVPFPMNFIKKILITFSYKSTNLKVIVSKVRVLWQKKTRKGGRPLACLGSTSRYISLYVVYLYSCRKCPNSFFVFISLKKCAVLICHLPLYLSRYIRSVDNKSLC